MTEPPAATDPQFIEFKLMVQALSEYTPMSEEARIVPEEADTGIGVGLTIGLISCEGVPVMGS